MMKVISVMTGFFWATILCGLVMAEPFAPLVEIPDDLSSSNISFLEAATTQKSTIPSQEEVGIPAYPQARILFTQMDNRIEQAGVLADLPNRIFMGAPDTVEQVVDFYKDHLEKWEFREIDGVPTFYKNGEFDPEENLDTPRIIISPETANRSLMPSSQTTIDIYYVPVN